MRPARTDLLSYSSRPWDTARIAYNRGARGLGKPGRVQTKSVDSRAPTTHPRLSEVIWFARSPPLVKGVVICFFPRRCRGYRPRSTKLASASSLRKPTLRKRRSGSFDDLEPEIGGFTLEIANVQCAVLALIKRFASIGEWHPLAQQR